MWRALPFPEPGSDRDDARVAAEIRYAAGRDTIERDPIAEAIIVSLVIIIIFFFHFRSAPTPTS